MSDKRIIAVVGALALASSLSCTRVLDDGPERLGSFAVTIDFDAQPTPGVALATCACPLPGCEATDLCPGAPGDPDAPLPFPGDRWATVRLKIEAVGTEGTRPFPITGPVSINLPAGEVFGVTRQARLVEGKAQDVIVRVRRSAGPTYIWVQDTLPRDDGGEPTHVRSASDVPLWFGQPRIADIQRTNDECCNTMQYQRVEITEGDLYVTRTTGNGFNVQDVSTPEWGGMFVFAFNGVEGLRVGSKLLQLDGAITEFQSSTQLTEPTYVPVNGICAPNRTGPSGGEEVDPEEGGGGARARCPKNAQCIKDEKGVDRCTPDGDPSLDEYGRRVCVVGSGGCPAGTECMEIEGVGSFCQVAPVEMVAEAFPEAPYCGPTNTSSNLAVEALEGMLVRITGHGPRGVRLEGLPVCKRPEGDDPVSLVRSTCNDADVVERDGELVVQTDCAQATNGDPLLRDAEGRVCYRGNQACLDEGIPFDQLRSSCLDSPTSTAPRCQLADPGDPLLLDTDEVEPDSRVCRNTLDDFLTSGFISFGQAKVYFEDENNETRCATVNFDALNGFDPWQAQEDGVKWRSLVGTLRQVRFRSTTSFWIVDVRYAEDLQPLQ